MDWVFSLGAEGWAVLLVVHCILVLICVDWS